MNAATIVDILTEAHMTPEEFVNDNPGMFAYFTFSPHPYQPNAFEVKRWNDGGYYYLGSVRYAGNVEQWYVSLIAPNWVPKAVMYKSREEAAQALLALYRSANSKYKDLV